MSLRELLLDPVAIKEVSGSSRRWQTYAGRCLYAGVIGWVIVAFWMDMPVRAWQRPTLSAFADLGRKLFQAFFVLQMTTVTLGAVASAADLVTKETRAGTLGLLACSPLTPWRIAFGKWKAAMAQTSTMILCGAPVLAICVFLGGATAWDLAYSFTLSVAAAAVGAALSLYFSSVFRTGVGAVLVSLAALAGATFLPAAVVDPPFGGFSVPTFLLCTLHPVYAALAAATPRYTIGPNAVLQYGWISATLVSAVVSLILLRRTAARIARLSVRPPAPPLLSRTFEAMDRFYDNAGPARLRNIRLFDRGGVWETRAILWKELKTRASGKIRNSVRISVVLLLLLSGTFWLPQRWMEPAMWTFAGILLMMALASGSSLFVKEKEERKWDILLATPLTAGEIVSAKVLAGLAPLGPLLALYLIFWGTLRWFHNLAYVDVLVVLLVTLLPVLLAFSVAAVCSLRARTLRGAFMTAFGGMAALLVAIPVGIEMMRSDRRFLMRCVSPAPYIERIAGSLRGWGYWNYYRFNTFDEELLIFSTIYAIGIAGLLLYLGRRFDAISGRSR